VSYNGKLLHALFFLFPNKTRPLCTFLNKQRKIAFLPPLFKYKELPNYKEFSLNKKFLTLLKKNWGISQKSLGEVKENFI
jgi:hypothetical protein